MPYSSELLRDALNTLEFSTTRDDEPMMMANIVAALVQLARARENTRQQIHQVIDLAWDEAEERNT